MDSIADCGPVCPGSNPRRGYDLFRLRAFMRKESLGITSRISCDCDTIECVSANFGNSIFHTWAHSADLWIDPGRGGTHSTDLEIDPGRGGTHSAVRKLTQNVAEHTLPTKNWSRTWQNTLCRPGNWPRTWRNTLCRPEIDPGHGRTHSADIGCPYTSLTSLMNLMRGVYKRRALPPCDFLCSTDIT